MNQDYKIKFIYFDFNGVLAEKYKNNDEHIAKILGVDESDVIEAEKKITRRKNIKELWDNMRNEYDEGHYIQAYCETLAEELGQAHNKFAISDLREVKNSQVFQLNPYVSQVLSLLSKEFELGIITNARPSRRTREIHGLGLARFFEPKNIIISTEVGLVKPSKEIFELAIRNCGFKAKEVMYCDDNLEQLKGAKNAGIDNLIYFSDLASVDWAYHASNMLDLLEIGPFKHLSIAQPSEQADMMDVPF